MPNDGKPVLKSHGGKLAQYEKDLKKLKTFVIPDLAKPRSNSSFFVKELDCLEGYDTDGTCEILRSYLLKEGCVRVDESTGATTFATRKSKITPRMFKLAIGSTDVNFNNARPGKILAEKYKAVYSKL